MEIDLARGKIEPLDKTSKAYKTLNALIEGSEMFPQTQEIVIQDIINSNDLQSLALEYETLLIKPMLSNGGGTPQSTSGTSTPVSSRPSSASGQRTRTSRNQRVSDLVKERDQDCCVLTGKCDIYYANQRFGFEVAHIVPLSILNKHPSQSFIQRFAPWIPDDFFANLDSCQNAIFLNRHAHFLFGNFKWFITLEENEDPNPNIYRAMQVAEDNALRNELTGRLVKLDNGTYMLQSSFKQTLFIGNSHAPPAKHYIKLHELLARILYMRGGGEDLIEEDDDDDQIYVHSEPQMDFREKIAKYMESMES